MKKFLLIGMMLTIPIIFLFGIFHFGKNIQASPAINGQWQFVEITQSPGSASCAVDVSNVNDSTFNIQQSGKFIHLNFDQTVLPQIKGKLADTHISLKNHHFQLSAIIQFDSVPYVMIGELVIPDCNQSIKFKAQREELAASFSGN